MQRYNKIHQHLLLGVALFICAAGRFPATARADGDKGFGPITDAQVGPTIDDAIAEKGKATFELKCSACHKIEEKYVGPALRGVTLRRKPEWIMNMMLNPQEMTQKDPVAKALFEEILVQMTFQNVSQEESRWILEFFRRNDSQMPKQ